MSRLSHRKIHVQDCTDCETRGGKADEITHEITLYSDLTEERRERLLDIANRCPVHRTARTCLTTEPNERVP